MASVQCSLTKQKHTQHSENNGRDFSGDIPSCSYIATEQGAFKRHSWTLQGGCDLPYTIPSCRNTTKHKHVLNFQKHAKHRTQTQHSKKIQTQWELTP